MLIRSASLLVVADVVAEVEVGGVLPPPLSKGFKAAAAAACFRMLSGSFSVVLDVLEMRIGFHDYLI